jgi:hypothetical protein
MEKRKWICAEFTSTSKYNNKEQCKKLLDIAEKTPLKKRKKKPHLEGTVVLDEEDDAIPIMDTSKPTSSGNMPELETDEESVWKFDDETTAGTAWFNYYPEFITDSTHVYVIAKQTKWFQYAPISSIDREVEFICEMKEYAPMKCHYHERFLHVIFRFFVDIEISKKNYIADFGTYTEWMVDVVEGYHVVNMLHFLDGLKVMRRKWTKEDLRIKYQCGTEPDGEEKYSCHIIVKGPLWIIDKSSLCNTQKKYVAHLATMTTVEEFNNYVMMTPRGENREYDGKITIDCREFEQLKFIGSLKPGSTRDSKIWDLKKHKVDERFNADIVKDYMITYQPEATRQVVMRMYEDVDVEKILRDKGVGVNKRPLSVGNGNFSGTATYEYDWGTATSDEVKKYTPVIQDCIQRYIKLNHGGLVIDERSITQMKILVDKNSDGDQLRVDVRGLPCCIKYQRDHGQPHTTKKGETRFRFVFSSNACWQTCFSTTCQSFLSSNRSLLTLRIDPRVEIKKNLRMELIESYTPSKRYKK